MVRFLIYQATETILSRETRRTDAMQRDTAWIITSLSATPALDSSREGHGYSFQKCCQAFPGNTDRFFIFGFKNVLFGHFTKLFCTRNFFPVIVLYSITRILIIVYLVGKHNDEGCS